MEKDFVTKKILEILHKQIMELPNKICLALSGGLDSNLLLHLINQYRPDIAVTCINMVLNESEDSLSWKAYDNNHIVQIKIDNILKDLPKLISIVDSPKWNLYHYYVFEEAKKYADICITGDGADELFGGYTFRYKKYLDEYTYYPYWQERAKLYLACHERDHLSAEQYDMLDTNMNFSFGKIIQPFRSYFDNDKLDPLSQVCLADMNGKLLHDFIPTNKAFEKNLEIKILAPFLNPEMIMFASTIPSHLKYDYYNNIGKLPLREIYPNKNSKKIGFTPQLRELWANYGTKLVLDTLNKDSLIFSQNIINFDWFRNVEKIIPDNRHITKLLQLVALEIWLNEHI